MLYFLIFVNLIQYINADLLGSIDSLTKVLRFTSDTLKLQCLMQSTRFAY